MSDRRVMCVKLGREEEALDRPPFKNELGQRLLASVSKPAWREWLEHSKKLINEYRIDLLSKEGQSFWMKECEKYFFEGGSALPPDFKPEAHGHDHDHAGHDHGHDHAGHDHGHDHAGHDHGHDHDKK